MIFTVCWLAFQSFVMYQITTAVQESGPLAVMLAMSASGIVLVLAYIGIVLAAAAVMGKAGRERKRYLSAITSVPSWENIPPAARATRSKAAGIGVRHIAKALWRL